MKRINEVSEDALIKRINRKLKSSGTWEQVRTSRGQQLTQNLGRHYLLDVFRNMIGDHHIDIEDLARELGVMRPLEQMPAE